MVSLDATDAAIVRLLQEDGRQTNRELAAKVGIAPSTCLERTRLLQQRGVIVGFHAEVELTAIGRPVQALVAVQVSPLSREVIDRFKNYVSGLPGVLSVFVVAGGEDFLVHLALPSVDDLHDFVMDHLSKRREVVRFRSSVIFQHTRNRVVAPVASA